MIEKVLQVDSTAGPLPKLTAIGVGLETFQLGLKLCSFYGHKTQWELWKIGERASETTTDKRLNSQLL